MKSVIKENYYQAIYLMPGIIIFAAALRFYDLGEYSYWYDEIIITYQSADLLSLLKGIPLDFSPYLYYLGLHFWMKYLGFGEWLPRLYSALLGITGVYGIYLLVRRYYSFEAGIFSSILLAMAPFHLYYSQEIKPYILLCAIVPFTLKWVLDACGRKSGTGIWVYVIAGLTLGFYAQLYGLWLAMGCLIYVFVFERELFPRALRATLWSVVLFIPALIVMIPKVWTVIFYGKIHMAPMSLKIMEEIMTRLLTGYTPPNGFPLMVGVLTFALILFGFMKNPGKPIVRISLILLVISLGPVIIFSIFVKPIYFHRAFLYLLCPIFVLMGVGIASIDGKLLRRIIFFLMFVIFAFMDIEYFANRKSEVFDPITPPKKEYREAAAYLRKNINEKDDVIFHGAINTNPVFKWYLGDNFRNITVEADPEYEKTLKTAFPFPEAWGFFDWLTPNPLWENEIKGKKRAWLVLGCFAIHKGAIGFRASQKALEMFSRRFYLLDRKRWFGVDISLFDVNRPPKDSSEPDPFKCK